MADSVAAHGFKRFKMALTLEGDNVEQHLTIQGAKLDQQPDLLKGVTAYLGPQLEAASAGAAVKDLRLQVSQLEGTVKKQAAELDELRALKSAKKGAKPKHRGDDDEDDGL